MTRAAIRIGFASPSMGRLIAAGVVAAALLLDRAGLERAAIAGVSVAYSLEYFRGVREAAGARTFEELEQFTRRFEARSSPALDM